MEAPLSVLLVFPMGFGGFSITVLGFGFRVFLARPETFILPRVLQGFLGPCFLAKFIQGGPVNVSPFHVI